MEGVVGKEVKGGVVNGVGVVLMCVGVWILGCWREKEMVMGGGVVRGLGMGFWVVELLGMMIGVGLECEGGRGYERYELVWEWGVMVGVLLGK